MHLHRTFPASLLIVVKPLLEATLGKDAPSLLLWTALPNYSLLAATPMLGNSFGI